MAHQKSSLPPPSYSSKSDEDEDYQHHGQKHSPSPSNIPNLNFVPSTPPQPPPRGLKHRNKKSNWEILEGLKEGQVYTLVPKKFEGFIMKKRKWPLKGYHKRYFILEKGMLTYGKSGWDIARGKIHGSLDAGLSVITTKPANGRIDIDAEDCIYHLKIKQKEVYMEWLEQLKQHRLYRQHLLSFKEADIPPPSEGANPIDRELNFVEKDLSNIEAVFAERLNEKNDKVLSEFQIVAKEVIKSLRGIHRSLKENQDSGAVGLRLALNKALQQNSELKSRLARISREASFPDFTHEFIPDEEHEFKPSDTMKSVNSEYYDACTNLSDNNSTEEEDEETDDDQISVNSAESEISKLEVSKNRAQRRAFLPTEAPKELPSLWGILRKNIGQDLSRVSMPVILNEPLSVLQRLSEQFEYSEILDAAAKENDPIEKLALVAAFAVSTYSNCSHRTRKPFNPILGETFELDREDKGFRFISEQVSHHPPISSCYCEGTDWDYNESTQMKTKFWGKSMEIQPLGEVHIRIKGDKYTLTKATTCVHNLFSTTDRWVDIYGNVEISLNDSDALKCQLEFIKASYWSTKKCEVTGSIIKDGTSVLNLYGHWNEAFHSSTSQTSKTLWRMGTLPSNFKVYYGFTRFAVELNEEMEGVALTDTRLRPDQRFFENGKLKEAEDLKQILEQKQRERRKKRELVNGNFEPLWFDRSGDSGEEWLYNKKYWEAKKISFKGFNFEPIFQ